MVSQGRWIGAGSLEHAGGSKSAYRTIKAFSGTDLTAGDGHRLGPGGRG